MRDLSGAVWHTSSRSGGNGGDCVEVAVNLPGLVALRDSKNRDDAALVFGRDDWRAFIEGIRAGKF
jgi:Domain of unknown function (DUF397)